MTSLSLADLSRNASVVSTDDSDDAPPLVPPRSRPARNFSAPRSLSPHPPVSPRPCRIPIYLSADPGSSADAPKHPRTRSKSRGRIAMTSTDDFKFGATLGEGSYSTASSSNAGKYTSHMLPRTGPEGHPRHDWPTICAQDPRKISSHQEQQDARRYRRTQCPGRPRWGPPRDRPLAFNLPGRVETLCVQPPLRFVDSRP
jgi:hypothetical protein